MKKTDAKKDRQNSRIWSTEQVASHLNHSIQWLYEHLPRLYQLGFPKKDAELGGWDSKAVEAWIDTRSNSARHLTVENEMLESAHGKNKIEVRQ